MTSTKAYCIKNYTAAEIVEVEQGPPHTSCKKLARPDLKTTARCICEINTRGDEGLGKRQCVGAGKKGAKKEKHLRDF